MSNRKRFIAYFLVILFILSLYLAVKNLVNERSNIADIVGGSQVSKSQSVGTIFSTGLGSDEVIIWITPSSIFINPFETHSSNLSSFSVNKDDVPELFTQREQGMNAITARAFTYNKKNFIILANNKPDHGAYSVDFGAVFDLETGKNVYKTPFPIDARSPLLEFKEGELVFTSYPKECSGEAGYSRVSRESYKFNVDESRFVKFEEKCV